MSGFLVEENSVQLCNLEAVKPEYAIALVLYVRALILLFQEEAPAAIVLVCSSTDAKGGYLIMCCSIDSLWIKK